MKVAYITNIAPHYRQRLWLEMLGDPQIEFHFFHGKPSGGIREICFDEKWQPYLHRLHKVRNIRFKRVLIYQLAVLSKVLRGRWDVVIVLGDMYIASNWIAAILARLTGKRIFFWGHGLYGNESNVKLFFRKLFLSLAHGHFLYGNHSRKLMLEVGHAPEELFVIYNSLDYDVHKTMRTELIDEAFYENRGYFCNSSLPVLLFIGRLTPEKKLEWLIDAVLSLKSRGILVNLVIVGEGPVRVNLQEMAAPLIGQVLFYGACYDEREIGRLLANADLCVSPGNVGLTAIHSLSFGTPVCTHDDMRAQMPEAEAIIHGETGVHYSREKRDLDDAIATWLSINISRESVRQKCYGMIDSKYNPYVQLIVFRQALLTRKQH